ncbi:SAM-dependent methyltransferase [Sphaerimonospora thailandensis]|uniref:S-adenosyl methyltransferase n=1 Tax=Sphaerimonospora thailandensis TaxID=795644 RepID=A0A8J3RA84_9ACTN|nr:SAM-dependent methyltransferase [Sphaerimonospora thailandensis]GIH71155.1 hypothetical protein Mth01_34080 [Sphaerimonospora thailandensis]
MSNDVPAPTAAEGGAYNPAVPNAARIYDYLLGGKDNFPADRAAAEGLVKIVPDMRQRTRENRDFLIRAVRHLADSGVRQFLDLGSGLPTGENVHEVVHRIAPDGRVVYVDSDEIAVVHGRALLARHPEGLVRMVHADVCDTDAMLAHPDVVESFDRSQPVAVVMVALLHFIPEPQVRHILDTLRAWLPPGSHVVITHAAPGQMSPEEQRKVLAVYERANMRIHARSIEQITAMFDGFRLTGEGVVPVSHWRPDGHLYHLDELPRSGYFAGGVAQLAPLP